MTASAAMIAAVEAVWRIRRPGPENLLAAPAFVALGEQCRSDYGGGKPAFALSANGIALRGTPAFWMST